MNRTHKKRIELGLTASLFGLFLLLLPGYILIWALALPGLAGWWLFFMCVSWWFMGMTEEWLSDE